jgi:peptide/nickel transport system ATP-binding protein
MRLLPANVQKYEGNVILEDLDIMQMDNTEFRKNVRWKKISIVFQKALTSLNPVIKVGFQVAEPLIQHEDVAKEEATRRAAELLRLVGIPETFVSKYPFELSGGMQQRVLIAMALIMRPKLIILDEPTSALDTITQANIMNLLKRLRAEFEHSYIFITHDISLCSELSDKVGVMYAGQLVELVSASEFFEKPAHPYAKMLMASTPSLKKRTKLEFIPGAPPSLIILPSGCRFHPRCPFAMSRCKELEPPEIEISNGHVVKCWLYGNS